MPGAVLAFLSGIIERTTLRMTREERLDRFEKLMMEALILRTEPKRWLIRWGRGGDFDFKKVEHDAVRYAGCNAEIAMLARQLRTEGYRRQDGSPPHRAPKPWLPSLPENPRLESAKARWRAEALEAIRPKSIHGQLYQMDDPADPHHIHINEDGDVTHGPDYLGMIQIALAPKWRDSPHYTPSAEEILRVRPGTRRGCGR
jgi:hypothetical protein